MLHGDNVILRGVTREDLPRLCRFNNDLAVELAGGGDPPMPQALERLQADFDREVAKGGRDGAWFAIEADGACIGQCGLSNLNETARTAELGIAIGDKASWGRGYGKEAVRLLLDYGFRLRNLERIWLWVHADNERAVRAYRACGFVEEGRLRRHAWSNGAHVDVLCLGLLRDDYESGVGT